MLGVAALFCCFCTWPQWMVEMVLLDLPAPLIVEASARAWSLSLRSESFDVFHAIRSDGASYLRSERSQARFGLVKERWRTHGFIVPGAFVKLRDEGIAEVSPNEGRWRQPPTVTSADCQEALRLYTSGDARIERILHAPVAGQAVVAYRVFSSGEVGTIAFAPDVGCMPVSATYVGKSAWGVPVEFRSWQVTRLQRGEPDPKLFEIPAGYRIEQH